MLKLSHPITSINGFKIGDRVRLKDGDGRPHIIKSFSVDGIKEFFLEVQFEDGTDTMLDNIAPITSNPSPSSNLDEVAENCTYCQHAYAKESFKEGAEWLAGQGVSWEDKMTYYDGFLIYGQDERAYTVEGDFNEGDEVVVHIRKK